MYCLLIRSPFLEIVTGAVKLDFSVVDGNSFITVLHNGYVLCVSNHLFKQPLQNACLHNVIFILFVFWQKASKQIEQAPFR